MKTILALAAILALSACGSTAVRKAENCLTCMDCGNSKCG